MLLCNYRLEEEQEETELFTNKTKSVVTLNTSKPTQPEKKELKGPELPRLPSLNKSNFGLPKIGSFQKKGLHEEKKTRDILGLSIGKDSQGERTNVSTALSSVAISSALDSIGDMDNTKPKTELAGLRRSLLDYNTGKTSQNLPVLNTSIPRIAPRAGDNKTTPSIPKIQRPLMPRLPGITRMDKNHVEPTGVANKTKGGNKVTLKPKGGKGKGGVVSGDGGDVKAFGFDTPSPDDVVFAAQSKGSDRKASGIGKDLASLSIRDDKGRGSISKGKKKIDVKAEYAKRREIDHNMNLVVVGHVDSGKSTLMGRLLYERGQVNERIMRKYEKESEKIGKKTFAYAWVLDQTDMERERGVTIDISTNSFRTANRTFTLMDAPGHRDFLSNMINGASQADVAILVVDSSKGEFETGFFENIANSTSSKHHSAQKHTHTQTLASTSTTKDHAMLVKSFGVENIIVAVNKMENCDWSVDRFKFIIQQMTDFFITNGFDMQKIRFVPVSGMTGVNLVKRIDKNAQSPSLLTFSEWYNNDNGNVNANANANSVSVDEMQDEDNQKRQLSLIEALDSVPLPDRGDIDKPLRILINDYYKDGGHGSSTSVSVSGRVVQGSVQVGDRLISIPISTHALTNAGSSTLTHGHTTTSASAASSAVKLEVASVKYLYHDSLLVSSLGDGDNNGGDSNDGNDYLWAVAGDMVTLNLTGIDINNYRVGSFLASYDSLVANTNLPSGSVNIADIIFPTNRLIADVTVFNNNCILTKGLNVMFHAYNTTVPAVIKRIGPKQQPTFVVSGRSSKGTSSGGGDLLLPTKSVEIKLLVDSSGPGPDTNNHHNITQQNHLSHPILLDLYRTCNNCMGRFTLFKNNECLATGVVTGLYI
ncbi:HBS1-like protein [Zancudomyces culisetae]|uniref:Elongation factor 1 alpha-like protein n=1 Tax=Zancudomyces culisetae TaxID=1213189 RepID=A0A1R1PM42_ZANCU|nr:HBS1-like protein [Zancudomyces culisetae]|eukprot:OMH81999.1 HBS1-like protein [Zancudomyces culisetae]